MHKPGLVKRAIRRASWLLLAMLFVGVLHAPAVFALSCGPMANAVPYTQSPGIFSYMDPASLRGFSYLYPIGGVSLDQAAIFMSDMSDVRGAYFDHATNRIVFVGAKNTASPVFNKDDLAVAIRAVVFDNTVPQVSIGNGMQDPMPVYYYGDIQNTNMGQVLESADYQLKQYLFGYNAAGQRTSSNTPGFSSIGDRIVAMGGSTPLAASISRYWISPKLMSLRRDDATGSFVFDQAQMQLQTEPLSGSNDPRWNQASNDFVQQFTTYYDSYAQENSIYQRTKELAKLVSVVKWLKDNNVASDYNWAKNYTPNYVATPTSEAMIHTPYFNASWGQFGLMGGVVFDTANSYASSSDSSAAAMKAASQAAAPDSESNHWDFTQGGQQYTSVAVAANAFRSVGGYQTHITDWSLQTVGDNQLTFGRAYNSLTTSQTGIGHGWSWLPARLTDLQPWNAIPDSPAGGYSGNYPAHISYQTLTGDYETYTYTPGSGYAPDKPQFHDQLLRNSDGSYSVYAKDKSYYKFSIGLALLMHRDRNGNGIYFQYDNTPNVTRINDDYNHELTIIRDADTMITAVKDWTNRSVSYGYDGSGNLVTVTDPNGNVTHYGYDGSDRLNSITDRLGHQVLTNTYNADSKLASNTNAAGLTTRYDYDNSNRTVTATDANNHVDKEYYDDQARLTQQTDAGGYSAYYAYATEPNPTTVTDKRGNVTSYTYDANGNVISVTYPGNKQVTYQYNDHNEVTQVSDGRYAPLPKITTYTYDTNGNLLNKNDAGIATSYAYDTNGVLLGSTDGRGNTTHLNYNNFGETTTSTDPMGATTTKAYDALGRVASITDPAGKVESYTYDADNNVLTNTNASGTITNAYNAENELTQTTQPDGQATKYTYDATGAQTGTTDALNHLTSYGYDQYQNQISRQDALAHTIQYAYDALNRRTNTTTSSGKATQWQYDANGNITKRIDASNRVTTYVYDALNRLTRTTYPDSSTVTYTYDDRSNLTTMVDATGTSTYAYDVHNRMTNATDPHGSALAYVYDNANNLNQVTYPGSKNVSYAYDAANRLKTVTDWNSAQTLYQYNTNGTLASKQLPNGITATYTYDNANRLNGLQYTKNSNLLDSYAYIRNGEGNVTSEIEGLPAASNSYTIFNDVLHTGWSKSWSWNSTINLADTAAPNSGTKDIAWTINAAWGGLHLRSTTGLIDTTPYNTLSFAMKAAGGGAHDIAVFLHDASDNNLGSETDIGIYGGNPNTSGYITYNIPLSALNGAAKQISAVDFEDVTGGAQTKLYVDDVKLTTATPSVMTLYKDVLAPGVDDWSWNAINSFTDTTQPYQGSAAIGTTFTAGYGGLALEDTLGLDMTGYNSISFALKGSQNGQHFDVQLMDNQGNGIGKQLDITPYGGTPDPNTYTLYTVPISDFQLPSAKMYGWYVADANGQAQPKIHVDSIQVNPSVAGATTTQTTTFAYDNLGRLVGATYPSRSYTYTYDAVGNRLASNENGAQNGYGTNMDNELTSKGTRTFTYDSQGNEISDGAKTLAYDFDNRMVSYSASGQTTSFKYDGQGNRTEKNINGTATYQYLNDNSGSLSRVMLATNVANNSQTYYIYGSGMVSQGGAAASSRQYYLDDGLGNIRYVTDNSGNTVQTYAYDPYGNQVAQNSTSNFTYKQQQNDYETGLTYLRARYYDTTTGAFLTHDPSSGSLGNAQTQNGYNYANDDPINISDPTGQNGVSDFFSHAWNSFTSGVSSAANGIGNAWNNFWNAPMCTPAMDPGYGSIRPGAGADEARNELEANGAHVPSNYVAERADNGKGWVFRAPGSNGNANILRIGEPTNDYPTGYIRIYNEYGQPVTRAGVPGPAKTPDTHFPLRGSPEDPIEEFPFDFPF